MLLNYAQHNYNYQVKLIGDDFFDSLATCINILGEELNYSTVTTNYTEDVFNSIGDLLLVVDNLGYVLFVNKSICQVLGYKAEEIERQHIKLILEPAIDFSTILENNELQRGYNYRTKSNNLIPVSLSISNFSRKDNPFMGHVIIARDISLSLKYEREIEEQNEVITKSNEELKLALVKAEESEKLKSAFLANMSHEIRTPLNGIMGFSELLQQPENSIDDNQNFGRIILKCSNQLLGIVNNVLDISKIEAGLMQVSVIKCNINYILNDLSAVYKQKIITEKKKIELTFNYGLSKNKSNIITDELRIRQIISNLLENAIKFTESGKVEVSYKIKNDFIIFSIKDSGIGISEDKREAIFKPFIQAAKSTTKLYGGTGLGLAIAKGLVQLLGGEISVTSIVNKGSTFIFTIPYVEDKNSNEPEEEDIVIDTDLYSWYGLNILLVEDDAISANLIKRILKPTLANVLYTPFGKEALELFYQRKDINLVIVDYKLPDIDGCEIAETIRKTDKDVPIIAQTAFVAKEDKKRCLQSGCNAFIHKPVKSKILLTHIAKFFEGNKR